MQQILPKQYLQVLGKTLLQHTLESIGNIPVLERIVLAVAASDQYVHSVLAALPLNIRMKVELVTGGAERAQSVRNAVEALAERAGPQDWVLVHDAVRPCVRANDVLRLLDEVRSEPAGGLLAQPVRDTLKRGDGSGHVINTVDRSALWQAATPQVFRYSVLLQALQHCAAQGVLVTDEASAIEALGLPVKLVQGSSDNIKLTWPEDLALLEALLQASQAPEQPELSKMQQVRIGKATMYIALRKSRRRRLR